MCWLYCLEKWLTAHSATVQTLTSILGAILTLILVATTIAYLIESHKSRKAAESQAAAAQESLRLLKLQYEDLLGQGPVIVKHALDASIRAVANWIGQAMLGSHHPGQVADPTNLIPPELFDALAHARRFSMPCAEHINSAIGEMRNAISHLQTLRQSVAPGQRTAGVTPTAVEPLGRAQTELRAALKLLEGTH
jgi:hypothetical protein